MGKSLLSFPTLTHCQRFEDTTYRLSMKEKMMINYKMVGFYQGENFKHQETN